VAAELGVVVGFELDAKLPRLVPDPAVNFKGEADEMLPRVVEAAAVFVVLFAGSLVCCLAGSVLDHPVYVVLAFGVGYRDINKKVLAVGPGAIFYFHVAGSFLARRVHGLLFY